MASNNAHTTIAQILMDKVREDTYPSVTHMNMLEESLPDEKLPEYLEILMSKVTDEQYPSISMIRRIQKLADRIG